MGKVKSFEQLIKRASFEVFLVDAYGVLYTRDGVIEGAGRAIDYLNQLGKKVFVVTNNTSLSIQAIAQKFAKTGIAVNENQIISSGLGLELDPKINQLIRNKKVYIYGWPTSIEYVKSGGGEGICEIEDAEVMVFMATLKENNEKEYLKIKSFIKKNPQIPVICANPDQYVCQGNKKYPVIGFYATKLEKDCAIKVNWMGKPYSNFSYVVKEILEKKHSLKLNKSTCFFDDNYENLWRLSTDLNISSCLITDTGLAKDVDLGLVEEKYEWVPDYLLSAFSKVSDYSA